MLDTVAVGSELYGKQKVDYHERCAVSIPPVELEHMYTYTTCNHMTVVC